MNDALSWIVAGEERDAVIAGGRVPVPADVDDPRTRIQVERAIDYIRLQPG